ncbi:SNF related kinase b [Latimeria chalumnae]|uniref:SNF related kinase b n=1 Tax=Latimeria chalumnae TaxID=7897 RepID=UPI0003C13CDF|nr:PREDICTED: SNF-related serine/threonine-protein kinase-like [Latimeria chalumnae]|eukprot:XP_006011790.1 PREDICTED: SNF-related serine/threonine-protein kinase-like [Latimeria chalumnae]
MAGMRSSYEGKIAGLYDLERTLGKGHFAVVKLARHVFTGEKVAVKVIDKTKLDKMAAGRLLQEVRCMKLVRHPSVVRLYEVIDTQTKLYLILELADGGDMFDFIMRHEGGLPEDQAKVYFAQIVRAISYCHKLHVVHRDLKPENVVFFQEQGMVKLTDFGFSNRFQPGKMLTTSCGSLAYSAPEILLGDEYDAPAVDVWSLGVILYMLVCGHPPFQQANDSETLTMILDCRYTVPGNISAECADLISCMLQRDPCRRSTLEQIEGYSWLQGVDSSPAGRCLQPLTSYKSVSEEEHEIIIQAMLCGNIADREAIQEALEADKYNHITATYFLLAERILKEKQNQNQNLNLVDNWDNQVQSRKPLSDTLRTLSDPKPHSAFPDESNALSALQIPKVTDTYTDTSEMLAEDFGNSESENRKFLVLRVKEEDMPNSYHGNGQPVRGLPAVNEAPSTKNVPGLQQICEEEEDEEIEEAAIQTGRAVVLPASEPNGAAQGNLLSISMPHQTETSQSVELLSGESGISDGTVIMEGTKEKKTTEVSNTEMLNLLISDVDQVIKAETSEVQVLKPNEPLAWNLQDLGSGRASPVCGGARLSENEGGGFTQTIGNVTSSMCYEVVGHQEDHLLDYGECNDEATEHNNNTTKMVERTVTVSPADNGELGPEYMRVKVCDPSYHSVTGESVEPTDTEALEGKVAISVKALGAASIGGLSHPIDKITTNSSMVAGTSAGTDSADIVIKLDPAKSKNGNLKEKILQLPLCEKALAFKIKPSSKESLFSFGHFNCCHVI